MNEQSDWITPDGHLNDEACAVWVDALNEVREHELPLELKLHAETCRSCKRRIVTIRQLINASIHQQVRQTPGRRYFPFVSVTRHHYRVAAIILVLLVTGISMIYIFSGRNKNHQTLFADNFSPYPDVLTSKGVAADTLITEKMLAKGLNAYSTARYDTAQQIFRTLFGNDPENDTLAFYLSNAIMATGSITQEVTLMLKKIQNKGGIFAEQARWYLALAYLKMNDYRESVLVLHQISGEPGIYKEKAEALIRAIDE